MAHEVTAWNEVRDGEVGIRVSRYGRTITFMINPCETGLRNCQVHLTVPGDGV